MYDNRTVWVLTIHNEDGEQEQMCVARTPERAIQSALKAIECDNKTECKRITKGVMEGLDGGRYGFSRYEDEGGNTWRMSRRIIAE